MPFDQYPIEVAKMLSGPFKQKCFYSARPHVIWKSTKYLHMENKINKISFNMTNSVKIDSFQLMKNVN